MQPSLRALADFYGALARLIAAGIPLAKAAASAGSFPAARRAASALERGALPGEALREAGFPEAHAAVVEAGAAAGRLEAVCADLAAHCARLAAASRTMLAKSLYPLVLLHLAAILLAIPPAVLAQEAAVFWRRAAAALAVVYGLGLLGGVIASAARRLYNSSLAAAPWIEAVPLAGGWMRQAAGARFARVFALLVRAGAGPLQALEAAGAAAESARLRAAAAQAIRVGKQGGPLAGPFENLAPPELARALALGQTTGRLDQEMEVAASALEASAQARLDALAEWLPRMFYIATLAFVAWQILHTAWTAGQAVSEALDGGF